MKDQKHLLKNIHRRKPIHSHSQPQGTSGDPERAAFEEEIDKLSREKTALENNILRFKHQKSSAILQLDDLTQRVTGMEQRQENLIAFLDKAVQNNNFVEQLARKLEATDFSAYNKKRRLPQVDYCIMPVPETSFVENNSSSRPDCGNITPQDFSNTLRLELSPAASDMNLVSRSTQSSNEDGESPNRRLFEPKDTQMGPVGLLGAPETLELSDTGTSFTFNRDSTRLQTLPQNLALNEELDGNISCHLNLTLASSSLQLEKGQYPQLGHEIDMSSEPRASDKEAEIRVSPRKRAAFSDGDATLSSSKEAPNKNQGMATPQVRVNDLFWEQFLTERPGASETEEASSSLRANTYDDQEDRRSGRGMSRNAKSVEHLSL